MEHRYGLEADFILDDEAQKLADEAKIQVHAFLLEKVKIVGNIFINL